MSMTEKEIVKTELEKLYKRKKRLTPEDVVEAAARPNHPLHHKFEWDDSEAGRLYRLTQAAGLIRSVRIRFVTANGDEEGTVRAWFAAKKAQPDADVPDGYLPEREVRENPALREAMLRQMRRDIMAVQRKYRHLAEFWQIIDEINQSRNGTEG